jgi:hypothetical protein
MVCAVIGLLSSATAHADTMPAHQPELAYPAQVRWAADDSYTNIISDWIYLTPTEACLTLQSQATEYARQRYGHVVTGFAGLTAGVSAPPDPNFYICKWHYTAADGSSSEDMH